MAETAAGIRDAQAIYDITLKKYERLMREDFRRCVREVPRVY
jgi:hypothetical protein